MIYKTISVKDCSFTRNKFKDDKCNIEIQGDGTETRAFCYVEDAVKQIYFLMENGKNNNIYNVGINNEITIADLVSNISKILNIKVDIIKSNVKLGSTKRRCPDTKKIESLGFQLKDSFPKGLTQTVIWYKEYFLNKS